MVAVHLSGRSLKLLLLLMVKPNIPLTPEREHVKLKLHVGCIHNSQKTNTRIKVHLNQY